MMTDEQWTVLEPLIDACRPHAKVPSPHLRRTLEAILWRHENGAKWRALPGECGPWWMAAQTFIRWARLGVWEKLLAMVQGKGLKLGMTFLDGTNPRASESSRCTSKGGSAKERDDREALGRSRGGFGTKACVIADGAGRAIGFRIAPGQAHELPHAVPLLDRLPDVPL